MYLVSDPFISHIDTWLYFSLFPNTNEFDNASDREKEAHSNALVALHCITHVLPLSCSDEIILRVIYYGDFHQRWNLNGWNDHIIQPAREAVLDYLVRWKAAVFDSLH